MNNQFIDHREYGLTVAEVQAVLDELHTEADDFEAWWKDHSFPEGFALVEMHGYEKVRDYAEELMRRHAPGDPRINDPRFLLKVAFMVDSMIS